jgi:hypothetical protein
MRTSVLFFRFESTGEKNRVKVALCLNVGANFSAQDYRIEFWFVPLDVSFQGLSIDIKKSRKKVVRVGWKKLKTLERSKIF